jgi:hypothetical protein
VTEKAFGGTANAWLQMQNIQFPYIDCAALHIEAILKNVSN